MGYSLCKLLIIFKQKESQHIPLDVGSFNTVFRVSLWNRYSPLHFLSSVQPQGSKERPDHMVWGHLLHLHHSLTLLYNSALCLYSPWLLFTASLIFFYLQLWCKHNEERHLFIFFISISLVSSSTDDIVSPQYLIMERMNQGHQANIHCIFCLHLPSPALLSSCHSSLCSWNKEFWFPGKVSSYYLPSSQGPSFLMKQPQIFF